MVFSKLTPIIGQTWEGIMQEYKHRTGKHYKHRDKIGYIIVIVCVLIAGFMGGSNG